MDNILKTPDDLERRRKKLLEERKPSRRWIAVPCGTCGLANGSDQILQGLKNYIRKAKLDVEVKKTGCQGLCESLPKIIIHPEKIFYQHVKQSDIKNIVEETLKKNSLVEELLFRDPVTGNTIVKFDDIPMMKKQHRLLLSYHEWIDPEDIDDYIALSGYTSLAKILFTMKPDEVIEIIKKSGLRGRGGAGFPTGIKWESCRKAPGDIKYVICNADEGDPGAYMDRALLEGNPHLVIEGMIIGAYAIGAQHGYVYVRQEYPLALKNLIKAINSAREYGLLGKNILGSGFDFDIGVNRGGGAFVCGESTALMASMEGKPGEPRAKYIHTVEKGLYNRPTTLNNVETWANVPIIIGRGLEYYTSIGNEKNKGTKIFSLAGKVNYTGLIEVPLGIKLREIIFDIGGGIKNNRKFKAVQTGGPLGGILGEKHLDLPVDFDSLSKVGSMMGSGGMIVMDETNCMVDVAKYFLRFLEEESCGKCVPCREGVRRMREVLDEISSGRGNDAYIQLLEEMGSAIMDGSLCALGGSAPNPVMTTIKYFPEEYHSHIYNRKCPAGVCKDLITYSIDPDKCTGCAACIPVCPEKCITGVKNKPHVLDPVNCIKCGSCFDVCRYDAVLRN